MKRLYSSKPSTTLSAADRHLLPLLDGTRDRDALMEALLPVTREGMIQFERDGTVASDEADVREALAAYIDTAPQRLAQLKLARVSDGGI